MAEENLTNVQPTFSGNADLASCSACVTMGCCKMRCLPFVQVATMLEVRLRNKNAVEASSKKKGRNTKKEKELIFIKLLDIAAASADMRDSKTWNFLVGGKKICKQAWCIVNGWKTSRVYDCIRRVESGERRPNFEAIRNNDLRFVQPTKAAKTQYLVAWLDRYAAEMGDFSFK